MSEHQREDLIMASHKPVTNRILGEVKRTHGCDLDTLTNSLSRPVLEPGL